MDFNVLVNWSHLVSLMIWAGGLFFLLIVLLPVTAEEEGLPEPVFIGAALKFRKVAWVCMAVFALTGWAKVAAYGEVDSLALLIQLKIGLGCLMILLGLVNTGVCLPKLHQGFLSLQQDETSLPAQKAQVQVDYQCFILSGALLVVLGGALLMVVALGELL